MNSKTKGVLKLDARIRVLIAAIFSVLSVVLRQNVYLLVFTGLVCILLLLSGVIRPALIRSTIIVLCCLVHPVFGRCQAVNRLQFPFFVF